MKCEGKQRLEAMEESLPPRGARIEMLGNGIHLYGCVVAPPTGSED